MNDSSVLQTDPSASPEEVSLDGGKKGQRRLLLFPMRLRFMLFLVLVSGVPVGSTVLFYTGRLNDNPILAVAIGVVGVILGTVLYEHFVTTRVHTLLAWIRRQRSNGFKRAPVIAVNSADEIGELSREMSLAISYFLEMRDRSDTLMHQKKDFLTIAEHQLRTPVNRLSWAVESISDPKMSTQERDEMLASVQVLLKRMVLVINNMLNSVSIEEGKFGYTFEQVNIIPLIEDLLKEFSLLAKERDIAIVFNNGDDIPDVYVDASRLLLALFNLVMNAIDYTPQGGSIMISLAAREKGVEVSVEDTGIGIPEDDRKRLFAKFYRSSNAKSMRPDGSGLGLYIVRNIVREHGADITVESREGSGTRFSFVLPSSKAIRSEMLRSLSAIDTR